MDQVCDAKQICGNRFSKETPAVSRLLVELKLTATFIFSISGHDR